MPRQTEEEAKRAFTHGSSAATSDMASGSAAAEARHIEGAHARDAKPLKKGEKHDQLSDPAATAEARATLGTAKEELADHHKSPAIADAIRASALADTAIGELQRRKDESAAAAQAARNEDVAAARDQAAGAQQQATTAQVQ